MPVPVIKMYRTTRGVWAAPAQWAGVASDFADYMTKTLGPATKKSFDEVTADWDHKIDVAVDVKQSPKAVSVYVHPTGPNLRIWRYVSFGTRRHKIKAKNHPFMIFPFQGAGASYLPHTRRGNPPTWGGPGLKVGPIVWKEQVDHPGYEGRHFEYHIMVKHRKDFLAKLTEIVSRRGARRARYYGP